MTTEDREGPSQQEMVEDNGQLISKRHAAARHIARVELERAETLTAAVRAIADDMARGEGHLRESWGESSQPARALRVYAEKLRRLTDEDGPAAPRSAPATADIGRLPPAP
jgi:hypothetical protein